MGGSKAIDALMRLKEWESENLPYPDSLVGHRLFLHLLAAANRGESLSVKMLCSELAFSAAAMRVQIRRLERDGWVTVSNGTADSRRRFVELTQCGNQLLREYDRQIRRLCG